MDTFRCLIVRNPGDLRLRQRISADEAATARLPGRSPCCPEGTSTPSRASSRSRTMTYSGVPCRRGHGLMGILAIRPDSLPAATDRDPSETTA